MRNLIPRLIFFLVINISHSQPVLPELDKNKIISVLKEQENSWNKGDIEGFLELIFL